jgi:prophage maintenance system killer protein
VHFIKVQLFITVSQNRIFYDGFKKTATILQLCFRKL